MPGLLASQRQEEILKLLSIQGGVRVSQLTRALAVSEMTVRRDIDDLAARGLCIRVHGGALPETGTADEPGFDTKAKVNTEAKRAIATEAAGLVQPGQSLGISGGTTTYWVAAQLVEHPARGTLTVVTNSVPVAELLYGATAETADPITVILTGGERTPSAALVGPVADLTLSHLHTDWLFLGVHSIDPEAGLSSPNLREATTSRAQIEAATNTVLCADSSKWRTRALARIAPLSSVDMMITDSGLLPDDATELRRHIPNTTIVK
jgi:DeoR/GlpR family transcriptional regulator of sugar metabolism